jgi:hypothetical protein
MSFFLVSKPSNPKKMLYFNPQSLLFFLGNYDMAHPYCECLVPVDTGPKYLIVSSWVACDKIGDKIIAGQPLKKTQIKSITKSQKRR